MKTAKSNKGGQGLNPVQDVSVDESVKTKSASLARAERQIKALQEENKELKVEVGEIRILYKQLVEENSQEKFDERRVNLLKSQIIQLERQMVLMSDSLSSRAAILLEVENALSFISETCSSYLSKEGKIGEVAVPRDGLAKMTESAEVARSKLYKHLDNTTDEKISRPLLMMDKFVKTQSMPHPVTLMDVCSGKTNHLNLKNVAKLESQLVQLYKQLLELYQSLSTTMSRDQDITPTANQHLSGGVTGHLGLQVSKSCDLLMDSTGQLLELSVLVPAAPWPPLQKNTLEELTVDRIMASLPSFPRNKAQEGRQMLEALVKAVNYQRHMDTVKMKSVEEDLDFHRSVYQLQSSYVQGLFDAVREGYKNFEDSANELLCKPLQDVLQKYDVLRRTASEDALKDFLSSFKLHAEQISDAVERLNPAINSGSNAEGMEALSSFGQQYLESVTQLQRNCQLRKDSLLKDLENVETEKQKYIEQCYEVFPSIKEKADTQKDYQEIITGVEKMSMNSSAVDGKSISTNQSTRLKSVSQTEISNQESSCDCDADGDEAEDDKTNIRAKEKKSRRTSEAPVKALSVRTTGRDKLKENESQSSATPSKIPFKRTQINSRIGTPKYDSSKLPTSTTRLSLKKPSKKPSDDSTTPLATPKRAGSAKGPKSADSSVAPDDDGK